MYKTDWDDILEIGPECDERFVDCQKAPELMSLGVSLCGVSNLAGNYRVGRTNPVAHTILYSVDGAIELHTEAGCQTVEKAQLITLPAHKPFLIELEAPHWTMVWFDLEDNEHWRAKSLSKPPAEYCQSGRQIFHLLSWVYYEREALLRQQGVNQLEYYLQATMGSPAPVSNEVQRLDQLFRDVEKKLHVSWTVEDMSRLIHYSAPHLHRLCQKRFGRSPVQQLIYLRMARAKYLLVNTGWSIAQIAEQVGYHDVFNFSKRFKKSVGIPPAAYRKQGVKELGR